jgi:hypothetical protein
MMKVTRSFLDRCDACRFALRNQAPIYISQGFPTVDLRLAATQQIQIWPVQHEYFVRASYFAGYGPTHSRVRCGFRHICKFPANNS